MANPVCEPQWSLERRESSGHLVWQKQSPRSKVRFRFDVEVLEFEKHEDPDIEDGFSIGKVSSKTMVVLCATFVAVAYAVSIFFPWYLKEKTTL